MSLAKRTAQGLVTLMFRRVDPVGNNERSLRPQYLEPPLALPVPYSGWPARDGSWDARSGPSRRGGGGPIARGPRIQHPRVESTTGISACAAALMTRHCKGCQVAEQ